MGGGGVCRVIMTFLSNHSYVLFAILSLEVYESRTEMIKRGDWGASCLSIIKGSIHFQVYTVYWISAHGDTHSLLSAA